MTKIVYWGNVNDTPRPTIDREVLEALRQIADVQFFDIKDFDMEKLMKAANKSDMFLFHGQVPTSDEVTEMLMVERIQLVLQGIKCKKVLWFMEKVWMNKGNIIERLLPEVDMAFFADGTWVRRMKEDIHALHPAAPVKPIKGKYRPELACDVAYLGNLYGPRMQEYEFLKEQFGDGVKFFDDKFGQDFADVCASANILVVPRFPFDDFFWSDRIYTMLSSGALVIHQRTYGLKEEGFKDGEHYFEYEKDQDFVALINSLLEKDSKGMRKAIAKNGQEFVKKHSYAERVKELIKKTNENNRIK